MSKFLHDMTAGLSCGASVNPRLCYYSCLTLFPHIPTCAFPLPRKMKLCKLYSDFCGAWVVWSCSPPRKIGGLGLKIRQTLCIYWTEYLSSGTGLLRSHWFVQHQSTTYHRNRRNGKYMNNQTVELPAGEKRTRWHVVTASRSSQGQPFRPYPLDQCTGMSRCSDPFWSFTSSY